MRRLLIALLTVVLLAGACGDDTESSDDAETPPGEANADGDGATDTDSEPEADAGDAEPNEPAEEPTTESDDAERPAVPTPEVSTIDELLALDRPIVAGHAGGDRSWPHSTMYGFHQAAVAGADVLEMDVMLTGDGVLVVQHDDTVDRTTETTGAVRDLTYDELAELDNGHWWSENWSSQDEPDDAYVYRGVRTGEVDPPAGYTAEDFKIETFRAVAETFPDHVLDVEIKPQRGDDTDQDGEPVNDMDLAVQTAQTLAAEIDELGRTDSVVVVSFSDPILDAFRAAAPDVATSPGTDSTFAWFLSGGELAESDRILQLPPEFDGVEVLNPELLAKADAEGLAIWVWPNDSDSQENPEFYTRMVTELGVEGIIAGRPDVAVEAYAGL